ncbi:MAG: mechanosensitive ion channel [Bacteroidales bacterium]|nr:mechanosensitive ion channel [Bacteroidales bacterium]
MNIISILDQIDSTHIPDSLNPVQAELAAAVQKIANTPANELINDLIDKAVIFGLKVLAAMAIYFIGAWLIRKIKSILMRIFERKKTDAAIASFVQSITSIALTILLIITTVGTLGIDTSSLAALLTGGGLAIGMALNGTVQNFAGGIMILIFRPFKAGDYIEAQGYSGTVSEVNITSTKLTTVDNRVIIIPNGILSNGTINNYSERTMRRLDITVNVEYGASSEHTREVLASLIADDARVLTSEKGAPADPFIALSALNDSSIQFVVRIWTRSEDYWGLHFDLLDKIYNELPKQGIKFPYPKLDIMINSNE